MANTIPPLKHKEEFRKLLADYHPTAEAKELFAKLNFVVLSGIAGGGRNTVMNYLVKHDNYYFIVSDTTRPPKLRDGKMEQNGAPYWFRSEEDVLADVRAGKYLEAELIHDQQVSGVSLRELETALKTGRTAIDEAEYGGVNNIARANPHAYIIGLLPPNFDEWQRRLTGRESISAEEYGNRMRTAEKVIENMLAHSYFHIVLNDTIDKAAADIKAVVAGTYTPDKDSHARRVAQDILEAIKQKLLHL